MEKFEKLCYNADSQGLGGHLHSILGSTGLWWHGAGSASRLVRVEMMLFGPHPGSEFSEAALDLRPVMTVMSRVTGLREIAAGQTVGPNRAFVARRPTRRPWSPSALPRAFRGQPPAAARP
ncbi:MAG: hypothetical protein LBV21_04415 [Candidatus Adiutrix sp.]|nr:hypothetical protein [Candidatus Adiutrix sp.]